MLLLRIAAVSGSGANDYLVVLALRPDWANKGNSKVLDIDTATFCFKNNDLQAFPTGLALFHQNYSGRTTSLSGYESQSLDQTVNDLHSKLIPRSVPLSGSSQTYLNAISHSIGKFNELLGTKVSGWNSQSANAERPDL